MELSEQEKNAIESVKSMFGDITIEELIKDKDFKTTIYSLGILDILIVIAIVDKLQKETEREKQYSDFYKDLCNKQQKEIEDLKTNYKRLQNTEAVHHIYIKKDKIREKIKELEKIEPADDDYNFELQNDIHSKIDVLKELLEEN